MKIDKQFVNTLEENIRKRGAMDKLISDSAQSEMSNRVKDILRALFIDDWQSKVYYQHQTSLKDNVKTQRGRLRLSSTEQACLHAHGHLPWPTLFLC